MMLLYVKMTHDLAASLQSGMLDHAQVLSADCIAVAKMHPC